MARAHPGRDAEAGGRRSEDLYRRSVRARVEGESGGANYGRFVVLDADTGHYEVGDEALPATARLRQRRGPDAVFYPMRVGCPAAFRMRCGLPGWLLSGRGRRDESG